LIQVDMGALGDEPTAAVAAARPTDRTS